MNRPAPSLLIAILACCLLSWLGACARTPAPAAPPGSPWLADERRARGDDERTNGGDVQMDENSAADDGDGGGEDGGDDGGGDEGGEVMDFEEIDFGDEDFGDEDFGDDE